MKRNSIILFLFCIMALSISINAFAFISPDVDKEESHSHLSLSEQIGEINSTLSTLSNNPAYGGFYYEGDKLIINIVSNQPIAYQQTETFLSAYPDVDIEYRQVKYSLDFLESVKDTLASKMNTWNISVLDANEVTNQVNVCLRNYNNQVQTDIIQFVDDSFGASDFLNFIDYSNLLTQSTVEDLSDLVEKGYYPSTSDADISSDRVFGLYSHGDRIIIGSGGYTHGIQSSALFFESTGQWAGVSYFTPANKL